MHPSEKTISLGMMTGTFKVDQFSNNEVRRIGEKEINASMSTPSVQYYSLEFS